MATSSITEKTMTVFFPSQMDLSPPAVVFDFLEKLRTLAYVQSFLKAQAAPRYISLNYDELCREMMNIGRAYHRHFSESAETPSDEKLASEFKRFFEQLQKQFDEGDSLRVAS